jgi:hypothetical protein
MNRANLSAGAIDRVALLFPPYQKEAVCAILASECGSTTPFLETLEPIELERFHFAALKLSGGDVEKLRTAVNLAKRDRRDLLVAADFANDIEAHKSWFPSFKN